MKTERLQYLIDAYRSNSATDEELAELSSWYEHESIRDVELRFRDDEQKQTKRDRIWEGVRDRVLITDHPHRRPAERKTLFPLVAKVAVAAVLVVALGFILFWTKAVDDDGSAYPYSLLDKVRPGRDRAVIRMANGQIIDLDTVTDEAVLSEYGLTIRKTKDGIVSTNGSTQNAEQMVTVSTPNGGQYKVGLTDGTVVWLNAASSLTYPTRFSSPNRTVYLEGEAYFEVTKSGHGNVPFVVYTPNQEIKVLGTSFNVRSYHQDQCVTTMRTGRVSITPWKDGHSTDDARIVSQGESLIWDRSEEHTSELQSRENLVCRLLLEKKKKKTMID